MRPEVIYEDEWVIVCYKPAGYPTQSGKVTEKDVASWAMNWRVQHKEPAYIGLTGRLDQPVEGLVILGKTKEATAALNKQMLNHQVNKHYLALVEGVVKPQSGVLIDTLERSQDRRGSICVKPGEGKQAILHYEVRRIQENQSLLDITIETGRLHQIRVQMANAGHPLLNDCRYGHGQQAVGQLALCAYKTSWFHPKNNKEMKVQIDPRNCLLEIN